MTWAFDQLQDWLVRPNPNFADLREQLLAYVPAQPANSLDRARVPIVSRLAHALQQLSEGQPVLSDVIVLMRQVIRSHNRSVTVSLQLWETLSGRALQVGSLTAVPVGSGEVKIFAPAWQPDWLPGADDIDLLEVRRHDLPVPGDGMLRAFNKRAPGYLSEAQRAAVYACLMAAPGSTTLISLPTGSGKSLTAALPAWVESRGGSERAGTTLVIVPTVSLALDHERRAREAFPTPAGPEFMPRCHVGGMSLDESRVIWTGVASGALPLLFLSPEALLDSGLYRLCLEAAAAGWVQRLVIDEAHLIETWGAGFRTQFQLLATYRQQLLQASGGRLRTVLLSATVSRKTQQLLEQLFAAPRALSVVQANRLRPEPAYWFSAASGPAEREKRVLEALYHLPRPAIVYVTSPDEASAWVAKLRHEGFDRLAAFSGDTDANERRRIVRDWNQDTRDLIIATAAFGLGVDKGDVRTVIHACLPENVDRFYQAVGRGGRDGLSAISLMCTAPDDSRVAFSLTKSDRITAAKARGRWEGLARSARVVAGGSRILVDLDSPPTYDPLMAPGERHREWNEHVLLLMQRAKLISISDARPASANLADDNTDPPKAWLELTINEHDVVSQPARFEQKIGEARDDEVREVRRALSKMQRLADRYSRGLTERCLAYELAEVYPAAGLACGGCPDCRRRNYVPYADSLRHFLSVQAGPPEEPHLHPALTERLSAHRSLLITWTGPRLGGPGPELLQLIPRLVGAGFQQVILPNALRADEAWLETLLEALAREYHVPHLLTWQRNLLEAERLPVFRRPSIVVYPSLVAEADAMYRSVGQALMPSGEAVVMTIHVFEGGLSLPTLAGRFTSRVNGMTLPLERATTYLDDWLGQLTVWR